MAFSCYVSDSRIIFDEHIYWEQHETTRVDCQVERRGKWKQAMGSWTTDCRWKIISWFRNALYWICLGNVHVSTRLLLFVFTCFDNVCCTTYDCIPGHERLRKQHVSLVATDHPESVHENKLKANFRRWLVAIASQHIISITGVFLPHSITLFRSPSKAFCIFFGFNGAHCESKPTWHLIPHSVAVPYVLSFTSAQMATKTHSYVFLVFSVGAMRLLSFFLSRSSAQPPPPGNFFKGELFHFSRLCCTCVRIFDAACRLRDGKK